MRDRPVTKGSNKHRIWIGQLCCNAVDIDNTSITVHKDLLFQNNKTTSDIRVFIVIFWIPHNIMIIWNRMPHSFVVITHHYMMPSFAVRPALQTDLNRTWSKKINSIVFSLSTWPKVVKPAGSCCCPTKLGKYHYLTIDKTKAMIHWRV